VLLPVRAIKVDVWFSWNWWVRTD